MVRALVSADTVTAVDYLKQEVAAGRVVGIAWIELHGGPDFSVHIAGEALRDPDHTRGMLQALNDQLQKLSKAK